MKKIDQIEYGEIKSFFDEITSNYKALSVVKHYADEKELSAFKDLDKFISENSYQDINRYEESNEAWTESIRKISSDIESLNLLLGSGGPEKDILKCIAELTKDNDTIIKLKKEYIKEESDSLLLNRENVKLEISNLQKEIAEEKDKLETIKQQLLNLHFQAEDEIEISKKGFEKLVSEFLEKEKIKAGKEQKYVKMIKRKVISELNSLKNEIKEELENLKENLYREELARYFYNEKMKLKGEINIVILFVSLLFVTNILFLDDVRYIAKNITHMIILLPVIKIIVIMLIGYVICYITYIRIKLLKNKKTDSDRTDELAYGIFTPYWYWLTFMFLGMFTIFNISCIVFFQNENLNINNYIPRIPLFSILVWFTWFCSKQFSYTKQICDEYEYKYALSKSYLSYRSEAIKLEDSTKVDALLITLLDAVIKNIATSPVQSVKMDCHTPFSEVFGSIKDVVKNEKGNKS